jgi:hypothetical protein
MSPDNLDELDQNTLRIMEVLKRANLKNRNDWLGMILELATVQAVKDNVLYIERTSQLNKYYQQDRSKGPDVLFEFDDHSTGGIECKNVNTDFIISEPWFKESVEKRFFPMYKGIEAYIVVIPQFITSPSDLANKIREQYHIIEVGFQVVDKVTLQGAIDIIGYELKKIVKWQKNQSKASKQEKRPC